MKFLFLLVALTILNPLMANATANGGLTLSVQQLKTYFIHLEKNWQFKPISSRYPEKWSPISVHQPWEKQGFPDFDGYGVYHLNVFIPQEWLGLPAKLVMDGVDDGFILKINHQLVSQKDDPKIGSLFGNTIEENVGQYLRPGHWNQIEITVHDWGGDGGLYRRIFLRALPPLPKEQLPEPIVGAHPSWKHIYWKAWEIAWSKISFANSENGFTETYMDEGFNEQIYQWDTCFIAEFGKYGEPLFPAYQSLDNFYRKQRPDGYIQRVYHETDGKEWQAPSLDEPVINPPLLAWMEWNFYEFSGNQQRLSETYPKLKKYFYWIKSHMQSKDIPNLYFQTAWGSGMDNIPRGESERSAWIDMSSQQALAALYLGKIAELIGFQQEAIRWEQEHLLIKQAIQNHLWNEHAQYFQDLDKYGRWSGHKHLGSFWSVLAKVASEEQTHSLMSHLKDPNEFYRPQLFPALSASDPNYSPSGGYWSGGIWSPALYMTLQAVKESKDWAFSREIAQRHLNQVATVYAGQFLNLDKILPVYQDGSYNTFWECYSPESLEPCTRGDNKYYALQDFVGWSGLGPISMLIEDIIGLKILGSQNTVRWNLQEPSQVGLKNFKLSANNTMTLLASEVQHDGTRTIEIQNSKEFQLEIHQDEKRIFNQKIPPGIHRISISTSKDRF